MQGTGPSACEKQSGLIPGLSIHTVVCDHVSFSFQENRIDDLFCRYRDLYLE